MPAVESRKTIRWRDLYFTFSPIDVPSFFGGLCIFSVHEITYKICYGYLWWREGNVSNGGIACICHLAPWTL